MTEVRQGQVEGWRDDPYGRHELRFFDGHRWTPYVRDGEKNGLDEPGGPLTDGASVRSPLLDENVFVVERFTDLGRRWSDRNVLRPDGTKAGIQPEKLLEAIRGGAYGRSGGGIGSNLEKMTLRGDWDAPRFALALARKDLGLATDLASEFGVPMPLAAVAEQSLIECLNRGWGGKDMSAAFALQEERAQVQVRLKQPVS